MSSLTPELLPAVSVLRSASELFETTIFTLRNHREACGGNPRFAEWQEFPGAGPLLCANHEQLEDRCQWLRVCWEANKTCFTVLRTCQSYPCDQEIVRCRCSGNSQNRPVTTSDQQFRSRVISVEWVGTRYTNVHQLAKCSQQFQKFKGSEGKRTRTTAGGTADAASAA